MDPQQIQGLIIPIGLIAFFYFFAIRPQKKKEKEVQEMRSSLKVGDQIITIGGIKGKITNVGEDAVTIEVGSAKTKFEMTKWSIGSVVNNED